MTERPFLRRLAALGPGLWGQQCQAQIFCQVTVPALPVHTARPPDGRDGSQPRGELGAEAAGGCHVNHTGLRSGDDWSKRRFPGKSTFIPPVRNLLHPSGFT